MIYQIFCLKDLAADVFGQPMFAASKGGQVRSFGDEVNRADDKNPLYMHADDFDMYFLGQYDDYKATFEILNTPELVIRGRDLKRKE